MTKIIDQLLELQEAEIGGEESSGIKINELRSNIPGGVLTDYDRLRKRSPRLAVVPLRQESCGSCYLKQPSSVVFAIKRCDDLQRCVHCGRFLFLHQKEVVNEGGRHA